ncbi:hypothetical protein ACOMHN_034443 [Nucella lapillus]
MESEPNTQNNDENTQNNEPTPPDQPDTSTPEGNIQETNTNQSEQEEDEASQSNTGGTNELLANKDDEAKPDSVLGSPRVQFGVGTKERDGSKKGVHRVKRSFKDIVLTEVMKADPQDPSLSHVAGEPGGPPPKGILKVRSDPALSPGSDAETSYVNRAYDAANDEAPHAPGTRVSTTAKSAFPFGLKGAGVRSGADGSGFADVVGLLIQRTSLDFGGRDVHPFGRDCSIEGIMQGSRPKSHSKNSAFSKLIIWFTLLSFLMGAALGVIFLSENYNSKQRADKLLKATGSLANLSSPD